MITINSDGTVTGGTIKSPGNIIQVQNTNVTAPSTISLTNHSTLYDTPLTVNITSTQANSKFSIQGLLCGEGTQPDHDYAVILRRIISGSGASISVGDSGAGAQVTRTAGVGYYGNDQDSTTGGTALPAYVDSPAQAAGTTITYKIAIMEIGTNDNSTFYVNRTVNSNTGGGYERPASYITVMEIAS